MEDLIKQYWKQAVETFTESVNDASLNVTDELINNVVIELLGDDEMWQKIDDTIQYYLYHEQEKLRRK